jgi:guanine deaminase
MIDTLILGRILSYHGDPFVLGPEAARIDEALLVRSGRIEAVGGPELVAAHPAATVVDYGNSLVSAGFVDLHVHYPQTAIIASWGKRLIDWLNTYTFPEEERFRDVQYAREVSALFLDLVLGHGTTSVSSFCTIHTEAVDAFFEAAEARGMAVVAGRTCMDRNAPAGLRDTAQSAYDESKELLERWHGRGRARYAVTPRFAPTSTREQLEALGALWAEYSDCPMQTHLSEQTDEVAWVADLFPEARDYLDVYASADLIGPGAIFGHAIHLSERERAELAASGSAIAHCPTSNTFIGSGLFDIGLHDAGVSVGLGTDVGGGSSFSMLRTMAAAYEIGQLRGRPIHPAQLWWLATEGAARALRMEHQIGGISPGRTADLVVWDLASTPAIAQRANRAETLWEQVFPTIMLGDDRAVEEVWIAGNRWRADDEA